MQFLKEEYLNHDIDIVEINPFVDGDERFFKDIHRMLANDAASNGYLNYDPNMFKLNNFLFWFQDLKEKYNKATEEYMPRWFVILSHNSSQSFRGFVALKYKSFRIGIGSYTIAIHEGYRKYGYGKLMMHFLMEIFNKSGLQKLEVKVFGHNTLSLGFHDKIKDDEEFKKEHDVSIYRYEKQRAYIRNDEFYSIFVYEFLKNF